MKSYIESTHAANLRRQRKKRGPNIGEWGASFRSRSGPCGHCVWKEIHPTTGRVTYHAIKPECDHDECKREFRERWTSLKGEHHDADLTKRVPPSTGAVVGPSVEGRDDEPDGVRGSPPAE